MQLSQLNGSRAGLFEGDLIYIGQYDPPAPLLPATFILEEELILYKYNLITFLNIVSKIIPSKEYADIISKMLTSLVFWSQVKINK